ncbi:hypothetical protein SAICODRAFT_31751 [Saitoella complicata NRRL Y-17804]|uniref:Uncharacterized protein n=1 Tax=Saitoella complicata (strain BCRC 22490 / CBS 7301 / JCM 7358 / NBRC 10748 / NRRL Y-17804) TaxID=698492 RepID=A0A0E9NDT0_SAICN|nr:uncharacterized protein SAICODRAFT_31751 [Saitoella complicata NRRL Y-17804]ODQ50706.1 hypothetical protein SAICODRAFT_31751 [Saitoella complicata NRRL Y-17804]GAO47963.1 hypothetical protein G7K_2157-t1 [Saitoella complicata NRRL Y-17804]
MSSQPRERRRPSVAKDPTPPHHLLLKRSGSPSNDPTANYENEDWAQKLSESGQLPEAALDENGQRKVDEEREGMKADVGGDDDYANYGYIATNVYSGLHSKKTGIFNEAGPGSGTNTPGLMGGDDEDYGGMVPKSAITRDLQMLQGGAQGGQRGWETPPERRAQGYGGETETANDVGA